MFWLDFWYNLAHYLIVICAMFAGVLSAVVIVVGGYCWRKGMLR
jgi:hypothetical protein